MHTPTPWKLTDSGLEINDASGKYRIAGMFNGLGPEAKERPREDAALIVQAVNAHERLIEAIENAVECDLNFDGTFTAEEILTTVEKVRADFRALLAELEGKE